MKKIIGFFQHLNFNLQAGEILAILGQNGCGKSTLLDLLLGIHRSLQGNIQLNDSIGFVPQFFSAPLPIRYWILC